MHNDKNKKQKSSAVLRGYHTVVHSVVADVTLDNKSLVIKREATIILCYIHLNLVPKDKKNKLDVVASIPLGSFRKCKF